MPFDGADPEDSCLGDEYVPVQVVSGKEFIGRKSNLINLNDLVEFFFTRAVLSRQSPLGKGRSACRQP